MLNTQFWSLFRLFRVRGFSIKLTHKCSLWLIELNHHLYSSLLEIFSHIILYYTCLSTEYTLEFPSWIVFSGCTLFGYPSIFLKHVGDLYLVKYNLLSRRRWSSPDLVVFRVHLPHSRVPCSMQQYAAGIDKGSVLSMGLNQRMVLVCHSTC